MAAKRDVKIAAWVLGLLLAGMGAKAVLNWMEEPVVSVDYVEKFNDMRWPQDYNPDNDGGKLFLRTAVLMNKRIQEGGIVHVANRRNNSLTGGYSQFCDSNDERWFRLKTDVWPGDVNDSNKERLRAWVAQNQQVFAMLEHAMSKQHCWFRLERLYGNPEWVDQSDLHAIPALSSALLWRARVKAADGDVRGSLTDVMRTCDMSRLFAVHPVEMEWFIGASILQDSCCNGLAIASQVSLADSDLASLVAAIERNSPPYCTFDALLEWFNCHRYDSIQRHFSNDGHGDGRYLASVYYRDRTSGWRRGGPSIHLLRRKLDTAFMAASYSWNTEGRKATLARWERAVEKANGLASQPLSTLKDGSGGYQNMLEDDLRNNIELVGQGRYLMTLVCSPQEVRTAVDGTLTVLAVLRYKGQKNAMPEGLDDLVKAGFLKGMPIDRYSGKPFIYKKTADGFAVYSVGEDGNDDGGDKYKDDIFWPVEKVNPAFERPVPVAETASNPNE